MGVEDLDLLERVRASYDPAMATFEGVLREHLSLSVTSRLKTVGTILDKLRREKTRLSTMQDIAGVRYVEEMTLSQQDLVVAKIVKAFPSARVVDRRIHSSYGYRAVHLVVDVDGCPVEVQVRTHLQNSWAQIAEAIADRVGRGLRYGDIPTGSEQFAEGLAEWSDQIAAWEVSANELDSLEAALAGGPPSSEDTPEAAEAYEAMRGYSLQERDRLERAQRDFTFAMLALVLIVTTAQGQET